MTAKQYIDRFHKKYICPPMTDCWLWIAAISDDGYGHVRGPDGKPTGAHRVSYELHVGKIPDGLVIDHLCRVRCCVNPAHLEPVTIRENYERGIGPYVNAYNYQRQKVVCKRGHELVYRADGKGRSCKVCQKATNIRLKDGRNATRREQRRMRKASKCSA